VRDTNQGAGAPTAMGCMPGALTSAARIGGLALQTGCHEQLLQPSQQREQANLRLQHRD
jgi:hypothetical protein